MTPHTMSGARRGALIAIATVALLLEGCASMGESVGVSAGYGYGRGYGYGYGPGYGSPWYHYDPFYMNPMYLGPPMWVWHGPPPGKPMRPPAGPRPMPPHRSGGSSRVGK